MMTKETSHEIEKFLNKKLLPEFGYVLIFGEPGQPDSGIISNYNGEDLIKILKALSNAAYGAPTRKYEDGYIVGDKED